MKKAHSADTLIFTAAFHSQWVCIRVHKWLNTTIDWIHCLYVLYVGELYIPNYNLWTTPRFLFHTTKFCYPPKLFKVRSLSLIVLCTVYELFQLWSVWPAPTPHPPLFVREVESATDARPSARPARVPRFSRTVLAVQPHYSAHYTRLYVHACRCTMQCN